jgi:heme-degrading monooxygenase HmoA
MIARLWHGWTKPENANSYEKLLRTEIFPSFDRVSGYNGAYLFREDGEIETEFVTLTLFEDLEAVRRFAGKNYKAAVVPAAARKLLFRFDQRSKHYQIVITPA